MSHPPSIEQLLATAQQAAFEAGRHTLAHFGIASEVNTKEDGTPFTRADTEAEAVLRRFIHSVFPDHGILGEEGGEEEGTVPIRWIIDPIDGTHSFIHGVPLFGTLVGVEVAGEVVAGVIYLPALNEMVAAGRGLGCTWNGRPCRVSDCSRLEESVVVTSDQTAAQGRSPSFSRFIAGTALQRTWGDCYGYALLATGRVDIALDSQAGPWDVAAILPIVEEAGGRVTDWRGRRTAFGGDAVATNGRLHEAVLGILQER